MSSLGAALNSALNSLQASQLGLSVASSNISNAQTPGYSRQRVDLAPSLNDGVDVIGIQALRDQLTSTRLNQEISNKSGQDTLQQTLQDIQGFFNDTQGTGLLSFITGFFNAFQKLSLDPTSMTNRQTVLQAAQSLVNEFHSQAANLKNQQQLANQDVSTDIGKINSLTSQIAALTKQIQSDETAQQPQNELRDQRSQLVQQLSQIVGVTQLDSGRTYELSLSSGPTLVFNGDSQNLTAGSGANGFYTVNASNIDVTSQITGGDLSGQIQLRDQLVPGYLNQLDQLAYQITQQVNTIHSAAYDLDGNTGTNFFSPLSSASGAASTIAVNSAITGNVRKIAASQDGAAGDNAAAVAIGNLLHNPVFTGGSITDQYGSLVFNIGNDTANAQAAFKEHGALATQLQNKLQSISGVSVDDETVQILQFQRTFQASSKLISAVDQMVQSALSIGTGR